MRGAAAGGKVRLKPLEGADAPPLAEAVDASRAALKRRFVWASGRTGLEEAARFIRENARGDLGIFDRQERLVGVGRLGPVDAGKKAKLALWIRTDEQDKGYAGEAARLLAARAFRSLKLRRLYARIDPSNRAARRVLRKAGFRYEGCLRDDKRLNGRWIDQECWGMLQSEWRR